MKQYVIDTKTVTLQVKKSPVLVRYTILIFAILCVLLPILGMVGNAIAGGSLKFQFFIVLGLLGLLSFYMFRVYLWNTLGREVIKFSETEVTYVADYKYFKNKQGIRKISNLSLSIIPLGYEEDQIGVLIIGNNLLNDEKESIQCVTKIPLVQLEELISEIENSINYKSL